jgi:long-subunit fatty acid transport protein
MGGTAIANVNDPSASFHNPAGYGGVEGLAFLGGFSLLLGHLQTSPGPYPEATNVRSDLVIAPFPLLSAGYRVHDWVTVGVGAYPVASGAASYSYPTTTTGTFSDSLKAVFLEVSPGVSINVPEKLLPGRLSVGVGYRATAVTFDRQKSTDDVTQFDLALSGWNFTGVRVGVQYSPITELRLGAVVRNKIEVTASAEEGTGFFPLENIELGFILPLKVGFGARLDIKRFGVGLDYEYANQSQNDVVELSGTISGNDDVTALPNHFMWQDGHTVRAGLEYRLPFRSFVLPLRTGYVFDGQVGNKNYPTAFGTPPTPTQSVTWGLGFHRDRWQVNAAGAYRFGSTEVTDVKPECVFCGAPGKYSISLMGIYLDASVEFDL